MITIEEAKAMRGFEFTYVYRNGDFIPAFVKEFDPEIGLTCGTLATKTTRDGWVSTSAQREDDGTWCVIGDAIGHNCTLSEALQDLEEIRDTGEFNLQKIPKGSNGGLLGVSCAFS